MKFNKQFRLKIAHHLLTKKGYSYREVNDVLVQLSDHGIANNELQQLKTTELAFPLTDEDIQNAKEKVKLEIMKAKLQIKQLKRAVVILDELNGIMEEIEGDPEIL